MRKGAGAMESVHGLFIEKLDAARTRDADALEATRGVEGDGDEGVAVFEEVGLARRILDGDQRVGVPVLANALLDPVEEGGVLPLARVEVGALALLDAVLR